MDCLLMDWSLSVRYLVYSSYFIDALQPSRCNAAIVLLDKVVELCNSMLKSHQVVCSVDIVFYWWYWDLTSIQILIDNFDYSPYHNFLSDAMANNCTLREIRIHPYLYNRPLIDPNIILLHWKISNLRGKKCISFECLRIYV